ncbi:uncharacterized protein LOC144875871 [Branchiostoma floridae x Branchiostoma japonicum]
MMSVTTTVSRCQRRNKKVVSARALLYTELGYIESLTEKSADALHQVCLSDGITIADVLAGNYRGRGVSRAAVEEARRELESDTHIKGDPNLRQWRPDGRHAVFLHKNATQAVHQDGDKAVDDTADETRQGCEDAEHEECPANRTELDGGGDVADITQTERKDGNAAKEEREEENRQCAEGGEREEDERNGASSGEREEDERVCTEGRTKEERPTQVPRARRGRLMYLRRFITGIGKRLRKSFQCCLKTDTMG